MHGCSRAHVLTHALGGRCREERTYMNIIVLLTALECVHEYFAIVGVQCTVVFLCPLFSILYTCSNCV